MKQRIENLFLKSVEKYLFLKHTIFKLSEETQILETQAHLTRFTLSTSQARRDLMGGNRRLPVDICNN